MEAKGRGVTDHRGEVGEASAQSAAAERSHCTCENAASLRTKTSSSQTLLGTANCSSVRGPSLDNVACERRAASNARPFGNFLEIFGNFLAIL